MTLPVALTGTDVIGQAKTGTGKTLGFGLPILERVTVPMDVEVGRAKPEQLTDAPQALVVVPTRELCQQVTNDLLTAGKVRNVRVLAIYGGRAYEPQVEALKKGVDVVVGTPGRLLDLAGQRKLDLSHVKVLVLDEADEMLDLGFLPDVEKIMNMLPAKRQTMLFSATMPGAVIGLARRYMSQPTHIRATSPDGEGVTVANIKQHVYRAHNMDKPEMVSRILQANGRGLAMIFCRTKRTAADIAEQLERRGFASGAVHGDLGQGAREQALRAFRNGKVDVLVCTDVAARGIDVEGVTHVINYQSPEDEKTFLHRVGRTGRAGNKGTAVTLVDWDDIPRWQLINKALGLDFHDPVETYSSSPHLFEELDIPAGTKGILPRAERTRAGLGAEELEDLGEPGGRRARGPRTDKVERTEERPERTRTPRQRRRTRGGELGDAPASAAPAVETGPVTVPVTDEAKAESGPRTPRRRRRTRVGAPGSAPEAQAVQAAPVAQAAPVVVEDAPAPVVEAPVVEAPVAAAPVAEPRAPRRRSRTAARPEAVKAAPVSPAPVAQEQAPAPRRRRARVRPVEDTVSFQTVETAAAALRAAPIAPVVEDAPAPVAAAPVEEPKKAPRRRTAKKAVAVAEPVAETVVAAQVVAEPVAEPVAPVVEAPAPVTAEVPAPRRRRVVRKAAGSPVTSTPVVEPIVEPAPAPVVEEEPKKPARRRVVRKAAGSPASSTPAETVIVAAPVAEAAPAPVVEAPVAAAPVVEQPVVEAPVEEPKKAPRRRAAKKAVAVAEPVAETVAVVEAPAAEEAPKAPRRRTAKKAVAAEAPDASEPKTPTRRRTTKKAVAEPVAEAAEAEAPKAPRRRTTKKAAAAQPES
ncbi:DEAD/DEAH box helicase [Streptomyces sp. NBC_00250]|uniref:DEAD/DEAH box helicase n=1 Tax=Streptomyces sp. NBC_00250 TaxID=2903641 RepID=UPI002E2DC092|nr:DEAD/DEAH box helicase [Streptomyces sp. NBC_00250]